MLTAWQTIESVGARLLLENGLLAALHVDTTQGHKSESASVELNGEKIELINKSNDLRQGPTSSVSWRLETYFTSLTYDSRGNSSELQQKLPGFLPFSGKLLKILA